jgi:hypothetical protein
MQTGRIQPACSLANGHTRKSPSTDRSQPTVPVVMVVLSGSGIRSAAAGSPSPPTMPRIRFVPTRQSLTAGTPLLPSRIPRTVKQGAAR